MNRGDEFLRRIRQQIIVGDGATGTMLYGRGVGLDVNFEHLNLVRPALVTELHREYVAAGAMLLETNTFGANRHKLEAIGLGHKLREINVQGVRLAREAAEGADVFVAGSMGPPGRVKGEEQLSSGQVTALYAEQSDALASGGADLLILETFPELAQLVAALEGARKAGLPVLASLACLEGGRTADGVDVAAAAIALRDAGAAAVGVNCGAGPLEILQTVRKLAAAVDLPVAAFPNSGFPEVVEGRYIYRATPEYFAGMAAEMADAGASLIGGCCGTTPAHIRALVERLRGAKPVERRVVQVSVQAPAAVAGQQEEPSFLSGWRTRKIVTVELDPPKGMDCSRVIEGARVLKEAGADAINLAENPLARVRMGNIALGSLIQREVGIPVIVHVTCRDRNLLGLQSELMGASLLGIRSILAVTGDPARLGDQEGASSVFDLNSYGLIKLLADLNSGLNGGGNPIGTGTGFLIGAAFNPNTPKLEAQVARLEKKVANGAQFVQTQPLYDPARFFAMADATDGFNIPVLPGILPLVSERNAEFLHNEVPGIVIPDEIRQRMKGKEKDAGVREGLAIAAAFIRETRERTCGYYLIPPFGKYEVAAKLVRYIRTGNAEEIA